MIIGIVGLGLIGGSLAKAFRENTDHRIFACDKDPGVIVAASLNGIIDGTLTNENIGQCDRIILCLYPKACVEYIKQNADRIKKGAVVSDICGTKRYICSELTPLAEKYNFKYVGTHPMAGTQYTGFSHSKASMFKGAAIIFCTDGTADELDLIEETKRFFFSAGFTSAVFTTAENHDKQIAYTSQLAHIVSNAYIKSPTAQTHKGFSAGSFRDMTRVANLNVNMWSELFLENKDFLLCEIETLTDNLKQYSDAIRSDDEETLKELLRKGVENKATADKG